MEIRLGMPNPWQHPFALGIWWDRSWPGGASVLIFTVDADATWDLVTFLYLSTWSPAKSWSPQTWHCLGGLYNLQEEVDPGWRSLYSPIHVLSLFLSAGVMWPASLLILTPCLSSLLPCVAIVVDWCPLWSQKHLPSLKVHLVFYHSKESNSNNHNKGHLKDGTSTVTEE